AAGGAYSWTNATSSSGKLTLTFIPSMLPTLGRVQVAWSEARPSSPRGMPQSGWPFGSPPGAQARAGPWPRSEAGGFAVVAPFGAQGVADLAEGGLGAGGGQHGGDHVLLGAGHLDQA